MDEKLDKFGNYVGVFIEVTANIYYAVKRSSEVLATSTDETELAKARKLNTSALLAKEGIQNYDNLKDIPKYNLVFKKFGIDRLNKSMKDLCGVQ